MANYNKSVNFAVKDTLQAGDPQKIVSGAEIDIEFNNISSSSTTKIDKVTAATAGNIAQFNATGGLSDSGQSATSLMPVGFVGPFAGTSAPQGWLFCNGQTVPRAAFPELFSVIGESFGIGDGTTTFNLPDLRDRFAIGTRSIGGTVVDRVTNYNTDLGDTGGKDKHQLTESEMPSHNHSNGFGGAIGGKGSNNANINPVYELVDTGSTGGDQPHDNM